MDKLNNLSGRNFFGEFSVNFGNELLLKLSNIHPNNVFPTKNHMMSYMSKAFRNEKHQAPLVNHESFRFNANVSDPEFEQRKIEKYLSEVEYSFDTSYNCQLRRKIASIFESKLAYRILTECQFDYNTANDQREELMSIKLAEDMELTYKQEGSLEKAVMSVYGNIDIIYEKIAIDKKRTMMKEGIKLEDLDKNLTWYKIRKELKKQYGDSIDKAWFSKLRAEENITNNDMILYAPTNFIRDWISNRYGNSIKEYSKMFNKIVIVETN